MMRLSMKKRRLTVPQKWGFCFDHRAQGAVQRVSNCLPYILDIQNYNYIFGKLKGRALE